MKKILFLALAGLALCGAATAGEGCGYYPCDCGWGYGPCHAYYGYYPDCRARLPAGDCGDFRYRDWLPNRHTYVFWSPPDHSWYYWCAASSCYYPYGQIDAHPPQANVVPEMPKGLPAVVPGGVDKGADMPPVPSDDAPASPALPPVGDVTPKIPRGLPGVAPTGVNGGTNMPPAPADGALFRRGKG